MADAEKKEMNANDLQREQVERLIETTADLQKQVLRKFANSVIEEMRYHFRVAMQKNELLKEENAVLTAKLARAQAVLLDVCEEKKSPAEIRSNAHAFLKEA